MTKILVNMSRMLRIRKLAYYIALAIFICSFGLMLKVPSKTNSRQIRITFEPCRVDCPKIMLFVTFETRIVEIWYINMNSSIKKMLCLASLGKVMAKF